MGMPKNLMLVRHGESEANIIQKKAKKEGADFPDSYKNTPDREFRLSKIGVKQAKKTGKYLKKLYPKGVDIIYVSDHTRAKETAAIVCKEAGWKKVSIKVDPQLGERNWGNFHHQEPLKRKTILELRKRDPLHFPMPDGETLLEARTRTRVLLERLARQHEGENVLVFTHGEYIEAIWSEIGHMRTEQQIEFFSSPDGDIKNCQLVEFKSKKGKFRHARSSNPYFDIKGEWNEIIQKVFDAKELLEEVNKYPHLAKEK